MKFERIIGQESAKLRLARAVDNDRMAHAVMLTGPEGVGQLALATALAQYVNCKNPKDGDSCGECSNCVKISKGIHPDVRYILPVASKVTGGKAVLSEAWMETFRPLFLDNPWLSLEAWQGAVDAENKQLMISVHEIRALKRKIYLKAFEAPYKIVILWHAERVRMEAANAFLKLLEEPPDRTLILMTCADPSKLLATINSRCQRVSLERVARDEITKWLIEEKQVVPKVAEETAAIAEGSPGKAALYLTDAQQNLGQIYTDWLRMVYLGNYGKLQKQIAILLKESKEFQKLFLAFAVKKLRDSLLFKLELEELALSLEAEKTFHQNFAKVISPDKVEKMIALIDQSIKHIGGNASGIMVFTTLSLKMHSIMRS